MYWNLNYRACIVSKKLISPSHSPFRIVGVRAGIDPEANLRNNVGGANSPCHLPTPYWLVIRHLCFNQKQGAGKFFMKPCDFLWGTVPGRRFFRWLHRGTGGRDSVRFPADFDPKSPRHPTIRQLQTLASQFAGQ